MTWTNCPVCSSPAHGLRSESVVLGGVAHTIPNMWLVGAVTAAERRNPAAKVLALYRDAMEAWAEQCTAHAEHGL